jgi:hypothetical protein
MVAFAFIHAEQLRELAAERGHNLEDLLDACYRGVSDLWKALVGASLDAG